MCDADGRATTGPVYCAGVSQCFDDIGINHPPINSGVISLNSPWLPLHMYCVVIDVQRVCIPDTDTLGLNDIGRIKG